MNHALVSCSIRTILTLRPRVLNCPGGGADVTSSRPNDSVEAAVLVPQIVLWL